MALVLLLHLLVLAPLLAIYHLHTHILKGGTRRSVNNAIRAGGSTTIYVDEQTTTKNLAQNINIPHQLQPIHNPRQIDFPL